MHALATPFQNRRIVLCVGGGIAAYKSVELLRRFVKAGAKVQVAMTESAQAFVGSLTFQTLSDNPVFTNLFDHQQDADIGHIRVADEADLVVVAPATANLLARVRAGMANDPVTAAVLATTAPVLFAPAMNVNMWNQQVTQENVEALAGRGYYFVGPDAGFLACKWTGSGRLSEPADIFEAACHALCPQDFAGKKIVVSAGGTREDMDPVRYLGNRSSGRMGQAIAQAACRRGAEVVLVQGAVDEELSCGAEVVSVRSAADMHRAIGEQLPSADVVIMAAAVADYRPASRAAHKIKKADGPLRLELERTTDILAELGSSRSGKRPVLVGFAAETKDVVQAGQGKLTKKGCDLVVANDVSQADRGFGSGDNAVELVWREGTGFGQRSVALAPKIAVANEILDEILRLSAG